MGKKTPSAPPPPDPASVAKAEAQANRLNTFTPTGSVIFGAPHDTVTVTESPAQRRLREQAEAVSQVMGDQTLQRARSLPTDQLSLAGVRDMPTLPTREDLAMDAITASPMNREQFAQNIFQRQRNLLQPEFDLANRRLTQDLANEGIPVDSALGQERMRRMIDHQNRALQDASLGAVEAGAAEEGRVFGQAMQRGGQRFNQALQQRQQAISERGALRNQQLNELAQLLSGQQIGGRGLPSPQAAPVDISGIMQNQFAAQQAQHQAAQNRRAQTLGALGRIGGNIALGMFQSAQELKDVYADMSGSEVLRGFKDMQPKSWSYKGDDEIHQGPMAHEWQTVGASADGQLVSVIDALGALSSAVGELARQVDDLRLRLDKTGAM